MVEVIFKSICTCSSKFLSHSSPESANPCIVLRSSRNSSEDSSSSGAGFETNIFLMRNLSDWRYTSLKSTAHIWKLFIFATTGIMRADTYWIILGSPDEEGFHDIQVSTGNVSCQISLFFIFIGLNGKDISYCYQVSTIR